MNIEDLYPETPTYTKVPAGISVVIDGMLIDTTLHNNINEVENERKNDEFTVAEFSLDEQQDEQFDNPTFVDAYLRSSLRSGNLDIVDSLIKYTERIDFCITRILPDNIVRKHDLLSYCIYACCHSTDKEYENNYRNIVKVLLAYGASPHAVIETIDLNNQLISIPCIYYAAASHNANLLECLLVFMDECSQKLRKTIIQLKGKRRENFYNVLFKFINDNYKNTFTNNYFEYYDKMLDDLFYAITRWLRI